MDLTDPPSVLRARRRPSAHNAGITSVRHRCPVGGRRQARSPIPGAYEPAGFHIRGIPFERSTLAAMR
ncbi:hypothetical protein [Bordetella genomosp. 1]|uniref:hypothetical protein n=1 Tax=Bordetella genomosp. 1 TaxID=1395607 RepID=UPI001140976D|nr:hypothetical protein [Bordetella genomosp. 1]